MKTPDFKAPRIDLSASGKIPTNTKKEKKETKHSDLFIRLRSGAIYAVAILAGCLLGNVATLILLTVASGICAYEFYVMLRSDAKLPNETLGILGAMAFLVSYFFFGIVGIVCVALALLVVLLIWYISWIHARIGDVCVSFFGAVYTGFLLTCLLAIRLNLNADEIWGGVLIIFILATVSINDGFAYLFGRKFGKHRLAPHISPKKSWEGFLAGTIVSTACWFMLLIFPGITITPWQCLVFGLICSILGVIGDLVESRIKRNSGVKDSGNLMPGHGGLLDRVDSIFLVSLGSAFLLFTFGCI
ncbi:MAG: phosphatidate cytidylyltransferase [Coriobacteriia bacterium]|nr:phosphatidate cytidylyltransferase [Coriobacteriia bacterium]